MTVQSANQVGLTSDNRVSECLDFAAPHCHSGDSWEGGHKAAGSMLTHANLSRNALTSIRDLSAHRFLECLQLIGNQIGEISGLHNLRFLKVSWGAAALKLTHAMASSQTLDLSNNAITRISGLDGLPLRELNLSGNRLRDLGGLAALDRLTSLSVADNQISTLAPLAANTALSYLDASRNALQHIRQTEFLRETPWLHVLLLCGNPCHRKELYRCARSIPSDALDLRFTSLRRRLRVLFRVPSLRRLDLVNVSPEEKVTPQRALC